MPENTPAPDGVGKGENAAKAAPAPETPPVVHKETAVAASEGVSRPTQELSDQAEPESTGETQERNEADEVKAAGARKELAEIEKTREQASASPTRKAADPEERLTHFDEAVRYFEQVREGLIGQPDPVTWWKQNVADRVKAARNFTRMIPDLVQRFESIGKERELPQRTVDASVISRDALLKDPELLKFYEIPGNREVMKHFLEQEVMAEVHAERVLMLKGLSVAEFQALGRVIGFRPYAVLSDDRRENAGRVAIDNQLSPDGQHPLGMSPEDPDYDEDMKRYSLIYPGAKHIPWVRNWHYSRTHGVVYAIKNEQGEDVLMFPVHIDPFNPIVGIKEMIDKLQGKKKSAGEHSAWDYHQTLKGVRGAYVGTGLYDLGIAYFIGLLKQASAEGKIGGFNINGEDDLVTTGSIIKDDRVTWEIQRMVEERFMEQFKAKQSEGKSIKVISEELNIDMRKAVQIAETIEEERILPEFTSALAANTPLKQISQELNIDLKRAKKLKKSEKVKERLKELQQAA